MQEPQEMQFQSLGQEDPSTLRDEEMPMDGDLTARTCWSNSNNNDEGNSWLCESSQLELTSDTSQVMSI